MMTIAKIKSAATSVLAAVVLTGGALVIAEDKPKPVQKDGLRVSIEPVKAVFEEAEPLVFDVTFENVSEKPFRLNEAKWIQFWEIELLPAPWVAVSSEEATPDYDPFQIKPGERISFRAKMGEQYSYHWRGDKPTRPSFRNHLPPGEYQLQPTIKQPGYGFDDDPVPFWVGSITPTSAKFQIAGVKDDWERAAIVPTSDANEFELERCNRIFRDTGIKGNLNLSGRNITGEIEFTSAGRVFLKVKGTRVTSFLVDVGSIYISHFDPHTADDVIITKHQVSDGRELWKAKLGLPSLKHSKFVQLVTMEKTEEGISVSVKRSTNVEKSIHLLNEKTGEIGKVR